MLKKNYLLGVGITNESEDKILEYLLLGLRKHTSKQYIVTPNPEILVYASRHPRYKEILNNASIALPDGVGVFIASGLMGNPLRERIAGVDFMEETCRRAIDYPITVGFLGGRLSVAEKTAECLKARYPWLDVVFAGENWPEKDIPRNQKARFIDFLFVAFGHPKQEEWIAENLHKLPVKVAMGVGGAFDYISGEVNRAPFLVRAMGFEWLYRLVKEPWRWRRQMALPVFVWLVFKELLGLESSV